MFNIQYLKPSFQQYDFQFFGREVTSELIAVCCSYVTRLLADDDGQSIGFGSDSLTCTVAQTEFLGNVQVVRDGQDAGSSRYLSFRDDHRTVVKRAILEEYVFYQSLCDAGVDGLSRPYGFGQRHIVLHHNQGTNVLFAHVQTGHNDGEDDLAVVAVFIVLAPLSVASEQSHKLAGLLMCSQVVEEVPDVFLEQDDEGDSTHVDQLVQNASQQFHVEDFGDDDPEADEDEHAIEDVDGARALHHLVAVVEDDCHKQYVYCIF